MLRHLGLAGLAAGAGRQTHRHAARQPLPWLAPHISTSGRPASRVQSAPEEMQLTARLMAALDARTARGPRATGFASLSSGRRR